MGKVLIPRCNPAKRATGQINSDNWCNSTYLPFNILGKGGDARPNIGAGFR